jgi:adenylate cyclase, class 2
MPHLNVEIKARSHRRDEIRQLLLARNADFRGTDEQLDTYFHCPNGRLKLRQGNIERSLIFYRRPDQAGPKTSQVHLYHPEGEVMELYSALAAAYGVWLEVHKSREIYFIDNVKFHLDTVAELGTFVEIEAIDLTGDLGEAHLREQCEHYVALFEIQPEELLKRSYSDLLAESLGRSRHR